MEQTPNPAPVKLTRKQEIVKFFQFVLFSLSAGIIQVVLTWLLHDICGIESWWLTYLPALVASVIWNFTVNRRFTFKSATNVPVAMLKVAAYYLVFTPLSTWWSEALHAIDIGIGSDPWYYIILVFTMLVNFGTEFLICRFWVFRKNINTNEAGKKEQERVAAASEERCLPITKEEANANKDE
ncbi:MAG: GtrA family protein [Clostridiales bacterium]|nr:GtrA family protein [Clostridiales bacterium]